MSRKIKYPWSAKAKRGFMGYPMATIAFYGPTNKQATKVVVCIIMDEDEDPEHMERWFSETVDARVNKKIQKLVMDQLRKYKARSIVSPDGLLGCPHEEGIDYTEGEACPQCPYWAGRDRFQALSPGIRPMNGASRAAQLAAYGREMSLRSKDLE